MAFGRSLLVIVARGLVAGLRLRQKTQGQRAARGFAYDMRQQDSEKYCRYSLHPMQMLLLPTMSAT
jgi:hypothetical protein